MLLFTKKRFLEHKKQILTLHNNYFNLELHMSKLYISEERFQMYTISLKQLSSLEKIFIDGEPSAEEIFKSSALKGEEFSYQIAFSKKTNGDWAPKSEFKINIISELSEYITVRKIMNIPSELSVFEAVSDDGYYTKNSGLFPDALIPLDDNRVYCIPNKWQSVWVSVNVPENIKAGTYNISIVFSENEVSQEVSFELEIIDLCLKKQELIFTQWFHCDCVADVHNVRVFSEEHWKLLEEYIKVASHNGINMILTPIFTPPLDTQVGGERPTVQLIGCELSEKNYKFNFDKLTRWIELCQKNGIEYFEISHLFTQWGAKCTPKIEVIENGKITKKFGWHTKSDDKEYIYFLNCLLPKLTDYLVKHGISDKTYFHISDEPVEEHLESYKKALEIIHPHIKDFKRIDALSDIDFYKKGLIDIPVPANQHIDKFLEEDIEERWTYYCCGEGKDVSNRFFSMPSTRNRIIGAQFFKFDIKGFLHWGYNFYYSQFSKEVINPYITSDACGAFPSGDAFSVYPYKNGVAESIRIKVFKEALQDLTAMQMLEEIKGKEFVLNIIEEHCGCELKFNQFPFWGNYIINYRNRINNELKKTINHHKVI